ncbi:MAG: hypothetical protein EBS06_03255 [Proteobacteria bacterium]|nr:hypothetical protein [Pseudomonadota bacterium]
MTKITQSFLFAAGRGERMRPLTDSTPKPLIKIKNKPIIDYTFEKLSKISDIKTIIVNGFYLADQIEQHILKLNNPKIIFSREIEKIETAGGLLFAKDKIDFNQPLLTFNGDVLWQENSAISDIELICNSWNAKDHDILLGLKKTAEYLGYDGNLTGGDFIFDGKKLSKDSKQKNTHVFVGLQIINPKILLKAQQSGVFSQNKNCLSMSYFYKEAVGENKFLNRVEGVELKGKYFHIGTVEAVKMTEENL